jgi:hypothetical protein
MSCFRRRRVDRRRRYKPLIYTTVYGVYGCLRLFTCAYREVVNRGRIVLLKTGCRPVDRRQGLFSLLSLPGSHRPLRTIVP